MTWFEEAGNGAEAAKEHVEFFRAASFAFASGTARFCTLERDITIGGQTFYGIGQLGQIEGGDEGTNPAADQRVYRLSGVSDSGTVQPSWITESDIDNSLGVAIVEYLGFVDPVTKQLVADPEVVWEGGIDSIRRKDGGEALIEIHATHRLAALELPDGWRYTHEHQQIWYPGDDGFDQVANNELKEVLWGGYRVRPGGSRHPRLPQPRNQGEIEG